MPKNPLRPAHGIALTLALASPAFGEITISDAYARSASPMAKSGAVFLVLHNSGPGDDRLIGAASDAATRVELHSHVDQGNGVMQMRHAEDGFAIAAGATHALQRGGDHGMFMGLTGPWKQGDTIALTLTFEDASEISLDIPVDLTR